MAVGQRLLDKEYRALEGEFGFEVLVGAFRQLFDVPLVAPHQMGIKLREAIRFNTKKVEEYCLVSLISSLSRLERNPHHRSRAAETAYYQNQFVSDLNMNNVCAAIVISKKVQPLQCM